MLQSRWEVQSESQPRDINNAEVLTRKLENRKKNKRQQMYILSLIGRDIEKQIKRNRTSFS